MKRVASMCLAVLVALAVALPIGMLFKPVKTAFAESFAVDLVIMDSQLPTLTEGTAKQNGHLLPIINSETGDRLEGNALTLVTANAKFKFTKTEDQILSSTSSKSVSMLVYVPFIAQDDAIVNITISGTNSSEQPVSLNWSLKFDDLLSTKEVSSKSSLIVPGWRRIELPFAAAKSSVNNHAGDTVYLSDVDTFSISHVNFIDKNTLPEVADAEYLSLYDITIIDNTYAYDKNTVIEESVQGYTFITASGKFANHLSNVLNGDTLRLPTKSNGLLYAWIGETKIEYDQLAETGDMIVSLPAGIKYRNTTGEVVTTAENELWKWMIRLSKPNGAASVKNFGETDGKYDEVGKYTMQLALVKLNENNTANASSVYFSGPSITCDIKNVASAIWFEGFSNAIDTKQDYSIKFYVDSAHWSLTNPNQGLVIKSSNEKVLEIISLEYNGNVGYVKVRGKKAGKATITIEGEYVRSGEISRKEAFKAQANIEVKSPQTGSNKTMAIVLGCVLGAGVITAIALGIVAIVKHNKMEIK